MKNLLFVSIFAIAVIFSSCGANQATVDAMSDDMCKVMEKYDPENPMSAMDILGDITEMQSKDGYKSVTVAQLQSAMESKCPEGWKKYEEMMKAGE